jgi:transcriptional regulator
MPSPKDTPERPDILRGTLDMMILKVLTAGPAHGYEVMQRIARASDEVILLEEGSLYPALHRIQKRGLVSSEWHRSASNRRARYYELTDAGRKRLEADVSTWGRMSQAIDAVIGSRFTAPEA